MDGVFVAYHNTERMFGFQYVSLAEMDSCLFGQTEGVGDRVFDKCVSLLEAISEEVVNCFPGQVRRFCLGFLYNWLIECSRLKRLLRP